MGTMQSEVLWRQAQSAFAANDMATAARLCQQILDRDKRNYHALSMLGQISVARNALDEAESYMQRAVALRPREYRAHVILGEILTLKGRYDDAVARYDKVLRREPRQPHAIAGKADTYEKASQHREARALLQPFFDAGNETPTMAVIQARLDLHDRKYDELIELAVRHLEKGDVQGYLLTHLCLLLGQAYERTGRYDEAFAAYERGNTAVPSHFSPENHAREIDELIETFSPETFAALPRASHDTSLPIFVVGMPRCGSTLVETILDAHPDVAGAGEIPAMHEIITSMSIEIGSIQGYPACIRDLDQADVDMLSRAYLDRLRVFDRAAKRIADKLLHNYRHVGMLAVLLPQARIIHCRRHPLDTCWSCFVQPLSPTMHPYATDLANLGHAYGAYERLMAHWRDVLDIPILEVTYETMVAEPEPTTRRLLEFCGLDWDDRCLRFHERKRRVQTASYDQVTRPIYSSSVARYKAFDTYLDPLKTALAEGG